MLLQKLFHPGKSNRNKDERLDHTMGGNKITSSVHEKNQDDSNELHQLFEAMYINDQHLTSEASFDNGGTSNDGETYII